MGRLININPMSIHRPTRIAFSRQPSSFDVFRLQALYGDENLEIAIAQDLDRPDVRARVGQRSHPIRAYIVNTATSPKELSFEVALNRYPTEQHYFVFHPRADEMPEDPIYVRIVPPEMHVATTVGERFSLGTR